MNESFPDRRDCLFGREAEVHLLLDRARERGLTVLTGRPRMGKTWVLEEVLRRLMEEDNHLIGYHESKASDCHLLRSVSDLYARWLSDSSMREQAIVLLGQHSESVIPRVGRLVGALCEALQGIVVPKEVGKTVRKIFDGLAEAQSNLETGGLKLAAMPYDIAASLANLVAKSTGRGVVLVLDAWEQSPTIRSDVTLLESFLNHQEDWPATHFILAIRNPELDSTRTNNEAFDRAIDLCGHSAALMVDLEPMTFAGAKERNRLIAYVRENVPAARHASDDELFNSINGYPGVVSDWVSRGTKMHSLGELVDTAADAQANRYSEFKQLLRALSGPEQMLAASLAFLPRLDADRWMLLQSIAFDESIGRAKRELVYRGVLERQPYATYGHDTRHQAARSWFLTHKPALLQDQGQDLIHAIAARITGINAQSLAMFETISACADVAKDCDVDATSHFLVQATRAAFGDIDAMDGSQFDRWFVDTGSRTKAFAPLLAACLIRRGFYRSNRNRRAEALRDFSAVIDLVGAPVASVAMALVNRGFELGLSGDTTGEVLDYDAVTRLEGAPVSEVVRALLHRASVKCDQSNLSAAIDDYSFAIGMNPLPSQVADALVGRGAAKGWSGDGDGQLADYSSAISLPGVPDPSIASALTNRGIARTNNGDLLDAMSDFTAVMQLSEASPEQIGLALICRGDAKDAHGDRIAALVDYEMAAALPKAPVEVVARALLNLGITKARDGYDRLGAIDDYTRLVDLVDAPIGWVIRALTNRGSIKQADANYSGAFVDDTTALGKANAPPQYLAVALVNRGICREQMNSDRSGAITDFSAAVELDGVPVSQLARALLNRGMTRTNDGDDAGALADYSRIVELINVPVDIVANALVRRAIIKRAMDNDEGAFDDYTSAIGLPGVGPGPLSQALVNRGFLRCDDEDDDEAKMDFTAAIDLEGSPGETVAMALVGRAIFKMDSGDTRGAVKDATDSLSRPEISPEMAMVARDILTVDQQSESPS